MPTSNTQPSQAGKAWPIATARSRVPRGLADSAAVRAAAAGVASRRNAPLAVLGDEIDRARLQLRQDLADIFADDANHRPVAPRRWSSGRPPATDSRVLAFRWSRFSFTIDSPNRRRRSPAARRAGSQSAMARPRTRSGPLYPKPDQPALAEGGHAMGARGGFVIDADLAEADPARQPLEETVALRQLPECRCRARRQQAEVAASSGIFCRAPQLIRA